MPELTLILDTVTGAVLLEEHTDLPQHLRDRLMEFWGTGTEIGCARPLAVLRPPEGDEQHPHGASVRVSGYYHNSLIEGPGRRSSVLVSGCELACRGCWVTSLHPTDAGSPVPVDRLADALLDPAFQRDGVSILGGEPVRRIVGV